MIHVHRDIIVEVDLDQARRRGYGSDVGDQTLRTVADGRVDGESHPAQDWQVHNRIDVAASGRIVIRRTSGR